MLVVVNYGIVYLKDLPCAFFLADSSLTVKVFSPPTNCGAGAAEGEGNSSARSKLDFL